MNKKIAALVLALGMAQLSGNAMAEPQGWTTPLNKICFINSGSISGGTAPAGQVTVVYGPYTAKCATTYHKFQLGLVSVKVQQLQGGAWTDRSGAVMSPASQYGSGTYRLVIDNTRKQTSTVYGGGTFSVPL
ncbi:hypothetical protein [Pseudomonas sp.]|uniref:hypothetical protein n=1 Tax=Pseudomonas sp. TaxID=306 RepID=UPI00260AAE9A|nr:hypothetical protein [Pseudomonas sp.]